jgi:hypothetical protein
VDELQTISVNRNAPVELRHLSSGETVAIIDDFLTAPDELRAFASQHAEDFSMPPKSYPGIVLGIEAQAMADIYRIIRSTFGRPFSFLRGGASFASMLSMTTLQPDELSNLQRLCHTDPPAAKNRRNFAFVLYLFRDDQLGGTGFYQWKEKQAIIEATALEQDDPDKALSFLKEKFPTYQKPPCYMTESNEIAERLDVVAAKFNRLVFYSGDIPHSAQISSPELLTNDANHGRLTLNCFASVRPKPG